MNIFSFFLNQVNAFDSDFSILELEYPIECSDYVSPVCLPSDIGNDYANAKAKVTGWGTLNPDTGEVPDVLYEVSVKTLSNYDCQEESQYDTEMITETMICAGEDGKDSCWGDSGGKSFSFSMSSFNSMKKFIVHLKSKY